MQKNVVYTTQIPDEIVKLFHVYQNTYGKSAKIRRATFVAFAKKCEIAGKPVVETALKLIS